MAKGNNGNLLQHAVEAQIAHELMRAQPDRFHVVITHSMAPTEPFEMRATGAAPNARLTAAIQQASTTAPSSAPAVMRAYRALGASAAAYPNSARILREVVGADRLCGVLAEVDAGKAAALRADWACSRVHVFEGSWRAMLAEQAQTPQHSGSWAWLLSMDPTTWVSDQDQDDEKLRGADLALVRPMARGLMASGAPGAVSIFCYELVSETAPRNYGAFRNAVDGLASALGADLGVPVHHRFIEVASRGANRHVAGVISRDAALLAAVDAACGRLL